MVSRVRSPLSAGREGGGSRRRAARAGRTGPCPPTLAFDFLELPGAEQPLQLVAASTPRAPGGEHGSPAARGCHRSAAVRARAIVHDATREMRCYPGGLAAVDFLARAYAEWPKRRGGRLNARLRALAAAILADTGPARSRAAFAGDVRALSERSRDERLAGVGTSYAVLADEWRELARVVGSPAGTAEAHGSGRAVLARICDLERAGVERLEAWLAGR